MNTRARLIAYYLPQFHPVPENDKYWGKGFTEWTNVAKAKPLYKGHYQPHLPTELGYYDLRVPEVREAQAALAREYGIEGFCYWHYWFAGKRVLHRPFDEVLASGKPDFPFSLCWANHPWTATWVGDTKTVIFEQTYPGLEDFINHFYAMLPAFKDKRYMRVEGNLLFSVFGPKSVTNCRLMTDTWRELAKKEDVGDFHFVGMGISESQRIEFGMDATTEHSPHTLVSQLPIKLKDKISYRLFGKNYAQMLSKVTGKPRIEKYADIVDVSNQIKYGPNEYPIAFPNWDHSPRSGKRALVIEDCTPELFGKMIEHDIQQVQDRSFDKRIVFIKAWNEWAEGNYLEPAQKYGRGYLEQIRKHNVL